MRASFSQEEYHALLRGKYVCTDSLKAQSHLLQDSPTMKECIRTAFQQKRLHYTTCMAEFVQACAAHAAAAL